MRRLLIPRAGSLIEGAKRHLRRSEGSAILEFAVALPLLVVFVVGIYDFSGAFNDKQKIEQAAQEGAIVAGGQPTNDLAAVSGSSTATNPDSLQPVVAAIFNSLISSGVITTPGTTCGPPPFTPTGQSGLQWTYTISGCPFTLTIIIDRGVAVASSGTTGAQPPDAVGSAVTVQYPYHWQFNSVIQLLIPGASYAATTTLTETATVHNQL